MAVRGHRIQLSARKNMFWISPVQTAHCDMLLKWTHAGGYELAGVYCENRKVRAGGRGCELDCWKTCTEVQIHVIYMHLFARSETAYLQGHRDDLV